MIEPQDQNEFSVFESTPALLAYVAAKDGLDAAKHVLMQAELQRDSLVEAAATLKALGLTDLAKLVRQHARKAAPSR